MVGYLRAGAASAPPWQHWGHCHRGGVGTGRLRPWALGTAVQPCRPPGSPEQSVALTSCVALAFIFLAVRALPWHPAAPCGPRFDARLWCPLARTAYSHAGLPVLPLWPRTQGRISGLTPAPRAPGPACSESVGEELLANSSQQRLLHARELWWLATVCTRVITGPRGPSGREVAARGAGVSCVGHIRGRGDKPRHDQHIRETVGKEINTDFISK